MARNGTVEGERKMGVLAVSDVRGRTAMEDERDVSRVCDTVVLLHQLQEYFRAERAKTWNTVCCTRKIYQDPSARAVIAA
jgi:hypothetical protein